MELNLFRLGIFEPLIFPFFYRNFSRALECFKAFNDGFFFDFPCSSAFDQLGPPSIFVKRSLGKWGILSLRSIYSNWNWEIQFLSQFFRSFSFLFFFCNFSDLAVGGRKRCPSNGVLSLWREMSFVWFRCRVEKVDLLKLWCVLSVDVGWGCLSEEWLYIWYVGSWLFWRSWFIIC